MARGVLLQPHMPRSSTKTTVPPPASRIVRRPTEAPRQTLRVVPDTGKCPHRAFELACLPHQAELYGVAMRIARDPDTAKDLVQETLLRAMVAWESFQPGSNLRAWLFRILTNAFINGLPGCRRCRSARRMQTELPP